MENRKIKIGITQGDINGIGYEVILKSLMDERINELCIPIIYGSPKVAAYHRNTLNMGSVNLNRISSPEEAHKDKSNIINCLSDNVRVELGKSTSTAGEASLTVLQQAVKDLKDNQLDALVTAPINKYNVQSKDFEFPGHTEYLKSQFNVDEVLMLMVNNLSRIGVLTGHIPLSEVSSNVSVEHILRKLSVMHHSLRSDFSIRKPRIALLGLNPHCGDDGVIGSEEKETIIPAIQKANEQNILAMGPYATDGFFGTESYKHFDGILAMYHDQGLTPFKTLDYKYGVNVTAGLPVIRTSPAHGTAFEIAGENKADHHSFQQAIYTAIDIYKNRQMNKDAKKNPLPDYDVSKL